MNINDIKVILNDDGTKPALYYIDNHVDLNEFTAIVKNIKTMIDNESKMLANDELRSGCHAYLKRSETDNGRFYYDIQGVPFSGCKKVTIVVTDSYQDNLEQKFHH